MPENDPNHRRLRDLGRAVVQAVSNSDEIASAVERLRREGITLYLVLDPKQYGPETKFEIRPSENRPDESCSGDLRPDTGRALPSASPSSMRPSSARPEFRLDTDDVHLLRSLGIDATRKGKKRRR